MRAEITNHVKSSEGPALALTLYREGHVSRLFNLGPLTLGRSTLFSLKEMS